jgi:FMN-dependent NADH-azoreductase
MRVLHVIATPRAHASGTLGVSEVLLATMLSQDPNLTIDELDAFPHEGPEGARVPAEVWPSPGELLHRFLAADTVILTCPTWGAGVPETLRHLVDVLVEPGRFVRWRRRAAPWGLVRDRQMVIVTTRGGGLPPAPLHALDHEAPEVRTVLGSVGVTDIGIIRIEPDDEDLSERVAEMTAAAAGAPGHRWSGLRGREPQPPGTRARAS